MLTGIDPRPLGRIGVDAIFGPTLAGCNDPEINLFLERMMTSVTDRRDAV